MPLLTLVVPLSAGLRKKIESSLVFKSYIVFESFLVFESSLAFRLITVGVSMGQYGMTDSALLTVCRAAVGSIPA